MLQAFSSRKGLKHVIQAPVVVRIVDWLQMVEVGNEFCCLTYKQKSNVASNSASLTKCLNMYKTQQFVYFCFCYVGECLDKDVAAS